HFAFEHLKTFDEVKWQELRNRTNNKITNLKFYGSDQDPGAIRMSTANAERAGVSGMAKFKQLSVNEIMPPDGPSGLVIVNPPYGERIGDTKELGELYQTLGQRLKGKFSGWRVGVVTSSQALAKKTGLKFAYESETIHHGGLRVKVYSTDSLP
ncbi:MAG: class I SAM-dependent RNA methyltransferase, partial [Rhodospirillaceae bacterium]|nr:class I SAM-dependent RNA methyltransferase [Rhodospirillaceae bacterium]